MAPKGKDISHFELKYFLVKHAALDYRFAQIPEINSVETGKEGVEKKLDFSLGIGVWFVFVLLCLFVYFSGKGGKLD